MIDDCNCFNLDYGREDTKTDIMNISVQLKLIYEEKTDKQINGRIKLFTNCKMKKYWY